MGVCRGLICDKWSKIGVYSAIPASYLYFSGLDERIRRIAGRARTLLSLKIYRIFSKFQFFQPNFFVYTYFSVSPTKSWRTRRDDSDTFGITKKSLKTKKLGWKNWKNWRTRSANIARILWTLTTISKFHFFQSNFFVYKYFSVILKESWRTRWDASESFGITKK